MAEPLRLYGLKALVTSAADGIGEAVARTLSKHGAKVLAVDSANSGAEQHFESVKGISGYSANLADPATLPDIVEQGVARLGRLDIVVNEFPLKGDAPVGDDERLAALCRSRAEFIGSICGAAMPHLRKSPAGRIINIGFLRSLFAKDADAAFTQGEDNLAELTLKLGADVGKFGITANYIQPGAIMTPASREVFRKDKSLRDFCIEHSAARRLGEPVDVAKVALFLASDDAAFVNGTGVLVDGGRAR